MEALNDLVDLFNQQFLYTSAWAGTENMNADEPE